MTPLLWMLAWLPQVLSAMSQLPQPGNLTLTSSHFNHTLMWKPGPGTPPGVYYRVTVATDRDSSFSPVAGCQHVQRPLQCDLTAAFSDPGKLYMTAVTAVLDAQTSPVALSPSFRPSKDTRLDLPRLTLTYADGKLHMDLQPPYQSLQSFYEGLRYRLRLESSTGATEEEVGFHRKVFQKVVPGQQYCVSICFWDSLMNRKSNYSRPVCVHIPVPINTDALIGGLFCTLVLVLLGVLVLLVSAGFMCLLETPLPQVLETFQQLDRVVITVPSVVSLSPVITPEPTAPSRGQRKNSQTSSDESDEETVTESITRGRGGGGRGGGYELRVGAHLLSSSSSSSVSAPLSPEPRTCSSSNQTSDSSDPRPGATSWTEPPYSLRLSPLEEPQQSAPPPPPPPPPEEEEHQQEEEEDVNLLTLTFGRQEEDEEEEQQEEEEEEELSVESSSALLLPQQTLEEEEAAAEAVCCSVKEEEEESGYMSRFS